VSHDNVFALKNPAWHDGGMAALIKIAVQLLAGGCPARHVSVQLHRH